MGVHILDVGLACLALCLVRRFVRRKANILPPGPPGWPLIGNLLDAPPHAPYKAWGTMSQKYGPIISLNLMGTPYVILNSPEVAKGLLEKSTITSDRPHLTMACDLVGWNKTMFSLQHGNTHRKYRKYLRRCIGTKSSLEGFYPAEETEAKQLLCSVMQNPNELIAHCRRMAAAVILKISHGYTVRGHDDPLVEMVNKAMRNFAVVTVPGRFLVDTLPILRYLPEWFPGGGFHKIARQWRKMLNEAAGRPYEFVLDHMAKGDAEPSFVSRTLQEGVAPEEQDILKWASFSMYLGGSDTTPSVVVAYFLAMTVYPEILKRAQAEVDAVVGYDRLPTYRDCDALPYINAICLELLRWHVIVAFAVHVSTQDIVYEGYLIPKGTHLSANIWFMLSDPKTYPNPEVFNPERFLGENQQMDPREVCFGWGRRACPGARLAELTIFTCVVMAVATLDVSRRVENGMEHVPRYSAEEGTIRYIEPFKCDIVPRSKKAEDLLQA